LAVSTTEDDGFREIQLNGKQLFFLFMAATTVLAVAFMLGMLVGRGVRVEREELARAEALVATPPTPAARTPVPTPDEADPRKAAPPAPAENGEAGAKATAPEPVEEPPVAVKRDAQPTAKPANDPKPAPASAANAPAGAAKAPPPASAKPAAAPESPASARSGYAVQVAAVDARGEADAIAKRLNGRGYSAYVEVPKGSASVFRVRIGTFNTRREAQNVADKLKKEEKFKPWVTR
jgi:cell division septation protein DedD